MSDFGHLKLVLVGMLEADTYVRATAELLYQKAIQDQDPYFKLLYGYLHTIGVPKDAGQDQLGGIMDQIFGDDSPTTSDGSLGDDGGDGIDTDYDQDNCDYEALISAANDIDNEIAAAALKAARRKT